MRVLCCVHVCACLHIVQLFMGKRLLMGEAQEGLVHSASILCSTQERRTQTMLPTQAKPQES